MVDSGPLITITERRRLLGFVTPEDFFSVYRTQILEKPGGFLNEICFFRIITLSVLIDLNVMNIFR